MRELAQRFVRGEVPPPPVATTIGFKPTLIEEGRAVFVMEADPARHGNPMGTIHGGILCDLADAAMGMAWASRLEEGETFTTLELKINFFKPVWKQTLKAEAKIVKAGRTVGMVECDLFDGSGALVARASSTCLTLRGEAAKGR